MIEPSAEAKLVEAFANTVDLEDETDALATAADATTWLRTSGLIGDRVRLGDDDHGKLLGLRTGLRAALAGVPEAGVLDELPVLVSFSGRVLTPSPALSPVHRALAELAIAWSALVVTGEAQRLKRCADDTCGWVFWDVSRNHSRRWCTMRVCGNRAKARAYSARQKGH
ncbi:CGNR zinc finger domain-containing protein [Lentzea tibetensis]|uniref:CGNR zinc finger domain-containing protein n=1 Tax=Lentzea tibetensis TaxID=2591470 RepID=A0A563EKS8_9PSEU|nr:CGNR zinc finger domain-containing protein [Lentzea tibetensis]TWP47573.1 CGNR zinc finger domain-containing protein [Lentzea tibetensis]